MFKRYLKTWWRGLIYDPEDPRFIAGADIKIAAIGGGTGLAVLLQGLKHYSNKISAIVTMTDDGKSSGTIRKEFKSPPPGDVRKCISALAINEKFVSDIFEYRFINKKSSLSGHTLGNLWLLALSKKLGSLEKAIEVTTEVFETAGKILPSALGKINLKAIYSDNSQIVGESRIPQPGKTIKKIELIPSKNQAYSKAVRAIEKADLIITGPGSLYTSIIPNFLIGGIKNAIKRNKEAIKLYVANCSTERGETENLGVEEHIEAIFHHAKTKLFDYCLVNNKLIQSSNKKSKLGEVNNITTHKKTCHNCRIIHSNLINKKNPLYHHPRKLAAAIIQIYKNAPRVEKVRNFK